MKKKNKMIATTLLCGLVIGTAGITAQPYATTQIHVTQPEIVAHADYYTGYVSVNSCNVRSSATKDTSKNIIGTLYKGDTFTSDYYDGYWYRINYNGRTAYISHKMVVINSSNSSNYSQNSGSYGTYYCTVNANACNVRSSASKATDKNIIGTLYNGDTVVSDYYDGYWYRINYNGRTAYVSHKMVTVSTAASNSSQNSGSYGTYYCTVNANACNVRSTASKATNKNIIGTLYNGDTVVSDYYDGYWYRINYNGRTAYVSHKMVNVSTASNSSQNSSNYGSYYSLIVTANSCNVRSTASKATSNNIIGTLYNGDTVVSDYYDGYWYRINYNGRTAYVSHKMVSIVGA
ncbi:MAG: SH3 domain-containing protein [Oscillospiraceae bacterium]